LGCAAQPAEVTGRANSPAVSPFEFLVPTHASRWTANRPNPQADVQHRLAPAAVRHRDHCAVLDIIPEADVIRHVLMGGARSDN
jgi:hypothetical protein